MNPALTITLNPVARITAAMASLAHGLLQNAPHSAAAAHRNTGPAADMLRTLPRGGTLTVERPLGLEVVCLKGTLWITHDEDTIDHVLESVCTYTARRGGRMLVHAMCDARFVVEPNDD